MGAAEGGSGEADTDLEWQTTALDQPEGHFS